MLALINESEYKGQEYLDALSHQKVPYGSLKEYIAYMLIAHQLYSHKIEIVEISCADKNHAVGIFDEANYEIVDRIGFLEFFNLLAKDKYKELEKTVSILKFTKNASSSMHDVDESFEVITERNVSIVYKEIKNELLKEKELLLSSLNKYFAIIDDYTLFFNINSKESINYEKGIIKNIEYLSFGKKVVAILTFILNYGTYCGDNSPLIIDHPEENLDN